MVQFLQGKWMKRRLPSICGWAQQSALCHHRNPVPGVASSCLPVKWEDKRPRETAKGDIYCLLCLEKSYVWGEIKYMNYSFSKTFSSLSKGLSEHRPDEEAIFSARNLQWLFDHRTKNFKYSACGWPLPLPAPRAHLSNKAAFNQGNFPTWLSK